jgi:hypothetical protein
MDDIVKGNSIDIGRTDSQPGPITGTGSVSGTPLSGDWMRDRQWWETNFGTRQYASADRSFSDYEPGYRFGYESANRYRGRSWDDIEPDLRSDWDRYEHRGQSTWENVKDSVRDAWDRLTVKK